MANDVTSFPHSRIKHAVTRDGSIVQVSRSIHQTERQCHWIRSIDGAWRRITTIPSIWPIEHVVGLVELADSAQDALDILAPEPESVDH